ATFCATCIIRAAVAGGVSSRLSAWALGTTSTCPTLTGSIVMKAEHSSSRCTKLASARPPRIAQTMQAAAWLPDAGRACAGPDSNKEQVIAGRTGRCQPYDCGRNPANRRAGLALGNRLLILGQAQNLRDFRSRRHQQETDVVQPQFLTGF